MTTVYEVTIDGGTRVEFVKGDSVHIEFGCLHVQDADCKSVAIFATFDSVIAKPVEQE